MIREHLMKGDVNFIVLFYAATCIIYLSYFHSLQKVIISLNEAFRKSRTIRWLFHFACFLNEDFGVIYDSPGRRIW